MDNLHKTCHKERRRKSIHPQNPNEDDQCIVSELDYICNSKKSFPEKYQTKFPFYHKKTFFLIQGK